jgi:hypothetical protein
MTWRAFRRATSGTREMGFSPEGIGSFRNREFPQWLKPNTKECADGTAEAAPLQSSRSTQPDPFSSQLTRNLIIVVPHLRYSDLSRGGV